MTEWRRTQESSHAVFSCSSVGKNSIFCIKCKKWIHQKCTHTQCYFKKNPNFVCKPCARHLPPSPIVQQHRQLSDIQLEQVAKFCYLGYIYDWSKWWLHGCSECQKKSGICLEENSWVAANSLLQDVLMYITRVRLV